MKEPIIYFGSANIRNAPLGTYTHINVSMRFGINAPPGWPEHVTGRHKIAKREIFFYERDEKGCPLNIETAALVPPSKERDAIADFVVNAHSVFL